MLPITCIGKCSFKFQEKEKTEDPKGVIFVMLKPSSLVLNKMQNASKQVAYPTAEVLHMEPVDTLVFLQFRTYKYVFAFSVLNHVALTKLSLSLHQPGNQW